MCERCDDPSLEWWEWIAIGADEEDEAPVEEPFRCEHVEASSEEGDEVLCGQPAAWVKRFTLPFDHLCDDHKAARERHLVEEFGSVPPPMGLPETLRFQTVAGTEACEEIGEGGHACGARAAWIELESLAFLACDRHRREP